MTPDQWKRTFVLVKTLSSSSDPEALLSLEQSFSEDPEVISEVRRRVAHSIGLTGLILGRYQIGELLGHGAFGEVYRGQDTVLGRAVALKFMLPAKRKTGKLLQEAQAASALNHPNIVTVHEVMDSESGPVMVMEFVEGESLRKVLARPLPKQDATRYARQLLEALSAAHAAGIVHRDLKPENIMIRPDGYLKVLDFGLAIQNPDEQVTGKLVGTLRYMSPEQCLGEPASAASDMFAAGLILYEMARGQHPFGKGSSTETARAILREDPKQGGGASVPLKLAKALLHKDPTKRPTAAQALKLIQSEKRRAWQAIAALLILAATAGGAFGWRTWKAAPEALAWTALKTVTEYETAGAIDADGSQYVYADSDGVIKQLLLTAPVEPSKANNTNLNEIVQLSNQRVDRIAWIGRRPRLLLSSRDVSADEATGWLNLLDLTSRQVQRLPMTGRDGVASPDGARVAYTSIDGMWIEIAGLDPPKVLQRIRVGDPTRIKSLFWNSSGSLVHFITTPEGRLQPYLWKTSVLHTIQASTGRIVREEKMPEATFSALMLQDGRILFLSTSQAKFFEIATDPGAGRMLGKARPLGILNDVVGHLTASLDGRAVTAVVQRRGVVSLHVGDLNLTDHRLRNVRLLSDPSMEVYPHSWTPDSEAVLFESSYLGTQDIFRQGLNQKRAERIVDMTYHQVTPQVAPDGLSFLFLSGPSGASEDGLRLWDVIRMPFAGGPMAKVPGGLMEEFACQYRAVRCVAREYHRGEAIFYDLDPIRGKGRELLRIPSALPDFGDWALSPDGRKISLVDIHQYPAAIRILDLDDRTEQRVELEGPPPWGRLASWSVDGKGWFLAQDPDRMMCYDFKGRSHFVHDAGYWLVPSWDGKKAAFTDRESATNAYVSRR